MESSRGAESQGGRTLRAGTRKEYAGLDEGPAVQALEEDTAGKKRGRSSANGKKQDTPKKRGRPAREDRIPRVPMNPMVPLELPPDAEEALKSWREKVEALPDDSEVRAGGDGEGSEAESKDDTSNESPVKVNGVAAAPSGPTNVMKVEDAAAEAGNGALGTAGAAAGAESAAVEPVNEGTKDDDDDEDVDDDDDEAANAEGDQVEAEEATADASDAAVQPAADSDDPERPGQEPLSAATATFGC
jgi:hypothetical protein